MSEVDLSVTLSRAHKFAERIKQELAAVQINILTAYSPVTLHASVSYLDNAVALTSNREVVDKLRDHRVKLIESLKKIRTAIDQGNHGTGQEQNACISSLLLEASLFSGDVAFETQVLRTMTDAVNRGSSPKQFGEAVAKLSDVPNPPHYTPEYLVTWLTAKDVEDQKAVVEKAKAIQRYLQDTLADANAAKIKLSLPEEVATLIGVRA